MSATRCRRRFEQLGADGAADRCRASLRRATCRVQRHRHRRARLRAPPGSARQQPADCSTTSSNGGMVLVNYNKQEFNQAQYGPYPARRGTDRVTDENAPIEVLVPSIQCSTCRTGSGRRLGRLGAGARHVLPRRARSALRRSAALDRSVSVQRGTKDRRAGRSAVRQRPLGA